MTEPDDTDVPALFEPEPTGHALVDAALDDLRGLEDVDVSLHPERFDRVHGALREALANAGRDDAGVDSP